MTNTGHKYNENSSGLSVGSDGWLGPTPTLPVIQFSITTAGKFAGIQDSYDDHILFNLKALTGERTMALRIVNLPLDVLS